CERDGDFTAVIRDNTQVPWASEEMLDHSSGPEPARSATRLIRTSWPDLRGAHRLGHAKKHSHTLSAATRRKRFLGITEAAVDVLPVVHRPDVAGRVDCNIGLHLQAA